ncbi:esterase-like activity of phytase family protein [Ascidiimonas sp. W6]|uniref:esterase-like activity of phytase family protein n=1 Tax=Ascidiimonas meishanensis TaxID=3128903 RepID=UPI0030EF7B2A
MNLKTICVRFIIGCLMVSCNSVDDRAAINVGALRFIGEKVIPSEEVKGTLFGGLSSIDYANGLWYAISDDTQAPIRFYTLELEYTINAFTKASVKNVTIIKDVNGLNFENGTTDPEALRLDPTTGTFIWASEGRLNQHINPTIREIDISGTHIRELPLPTMFSLEETTRKVGPRQNGTIEGLSLSRDNKGYWIGMELPLKQDGNPPLLLNSNAPVRITLMDKFLGTVQKQYVYELDNVVRDSNPPGGFKINGLVELLALSDLSFLVLERSFATGYEDGGNNVKIYKVDATAASDVKNREQLRDGFYTPVTKTLLFDFESIRSQLTNGVVDNIEGITFGPDLSNGNKSIVVIADNNFSEFGPQLNQIIAFEVMPQER